MTEIEQAMGRGLKADPVDLLQHVDPDVERGGGHCAGDRDCAEHAQGRSEFP
jgi:hypothetical protein